MRIKIALLLVILGILFLFPEKVQARKSGYLYYYSPDGRGGVSWTAEEIDLGEKASVEEQALILFQAFFEGHRTGFVPDGVRLLDVWSEDGVLYVDVSEEILQYGGSYHERCLISQIIRTALEMEGVQSVTLLIEGNRHGLAEGSYVDGEIAWIDMTEDGH